MCARACLLSVPCAALATAKQLSTTLVAVIGTVIGLTVFALLILLLRGNVRRGTLTEKMEEQKLDETDMPMLRRQATEHSLVDSRGRDDESHTGTNSSLGSVYTSVIYEDCATGASGSNLTYMTADSRSGILRGSSLRDTVSRGRSVAPVSSPDSGLESYVAGSSMYESCVTNTEAWAGDKENLQEEAYIVLSGSMSKNQPSFAKMPLASLLEPSPAHASEDLYLTVTDDLSSTCQTMSNEPGSDFLQASGKCSPCITNAHGEIAEVYEPTDTSDLYKSPSLSERVRAAQDDQVHCKPVGKEATRCTITGKRPPKPPRLATSFRVAKSTPISDSDNYEVSPGDLSLSQQYIDVSQLASEQLGVSVHHLLPYSKVALSKSTPDLQDLSRAMPPGELATPYVLDSSIANTNSLSTPDLKQLDAVQAACGLNNYELPENNASPRRY